MRCTWTVLAVAGLSSPVWAAPAGSEGLSIDESRATMLEAAPPADVMVPVHLDPAAVPSVVSSHILYLNNCLPNGCKVTQGTTDSRTDHSDIPKVGTGTLTPFAGGTTTWNSVVSCVKTVMQPFNITVTDVDPGTAEHFEVMIAGHASTLGLQTGILGIADYPCQDVGVCSQYLPDALVFAFSSDIGNNVNALCGTASQEIAHAWTLDHTINANDPMTYKNYSGTLTFANAVQCGSDCQYSCPSGTGTCNAFGITCSGSGLTGTHVCMETNTQTQDETNIVKALFGPAGAQPPTLAITSPKNGDAEQSGFAITATCTSPDGVKEVDLTFDGAPKASLTTPPFNFTAPGGLADGPHHISIMCATNNIAVATAELDVIVGQKCGSDSDCTQANYICYGGACIAGPNAMGGLGATCTGNAGCVSGSCANDGTTMACVVPCDPANDNCPSGFGCLSTGTTGVCWAGIDKSSGGGCSTGGDGASILLGLGFAAALVTRRKK